MDSSNSPTSILFVDDDPAMPPLVKATLSRPHWSVDSVVSGEEAVERLKTSKFHLVITDLQMPGMTGHDLTAHVSSNYPEVPVVVLTGKGSESTAVECFREGAADYVTKSNLRSDLLGVVAKLLEEEADLDRNQAHEEVDLSPSEESPRASSALDEDKDYVRKKWGSSLKSINAEQSEATEFTPEKLRILRRQAERLWKWNKLDPAISQMRRHKRVQFADIVFILPVDDAGQPIFGRRFISFCCNISAGGCSLIHSRLFQNKDFVLFFPKLAEARSVASAVRAQIVRDRPLSMGMYELGCKFLEVKSMPEEDIAILLAAQRAVPSDKK